MNKNLKIAVIILIVVVVGFALFLLASNANNQEQSATRVSSFEECVAAGYPVMESYPAQCGVPGGEVFVQNVGNELDKMDFIRISSPRPGETVVVDDVIEVAGEATGYWYFEASFPIDLINESGDVIGAGVATAQGDWMTEEFVPFVAEIDIESSYSGEAELVLHRSNPSGLPENADELIVPITLERLDSEGRTSSAPKNIDSEPKQTVGCFVGGCSGQICSDDPNIMSTCEWREEYACYRQSVCERQASGECGWTETEEFKQCMSNVSTDPNLRIDINM